MSNILFISYATLKNLLLLFVVVLVPILILLRKNLVRSYQLARKAPGPALWKILTFQFACPFSGDHLGHLFNISSGYDFKPWTLWTGLQHITVISDPDTLGEAFRSKNLSNKYDKFYQGVRDMLGDSSFVLNGVGWKVRRNLARPAFNRTSLENNLDLFYEESNKLVQRLRKEIGGTDVDIRDPIGSTIVRSSFRSMVEQEMELDDKFVDDVSWVLQIGLSQVQNKFINPVYCFLAEHFNTNSKEMRHDLDKKVDSIVQVIRDAKQRVESQSETDGKAMETLTAVLTLVTHNKDILTDEEVVRELLTVIAASIETTATAVTAVICLLALNPEVQKRVADEIESVFGSSDRPITTDDISRLEYLERVIKEAMRLFPPGSILLKGVEEETDLNGTIVPKKSCVVYNVFALHRNPKSFKDPLKFDPDRFSPGAQEERHPYAYLPFSTGARNCVGRHHAMMVMKTVLSTLLRNFQFLPGDKMKTFSDIKMKLSLTMRFSGTSVRLIPVNGARA